MIDPPTRRACIARAQAALEPPERETNYPEPSMFGELPAYGFFIRHARGVELSNVAQVLQNSCSFGRPGFALPELYFCAFALLVITDHKLPEQFVERFVLESVLCSRDAKRNVIRTRKSPRITNPTGQECDDGRHASLFR